MLTLQDDFPLTYTEILLQTPIGRLTEADHAWAMRRLVWLMEKYPNTTEQESEQFQRLADHMGAWECRHFPMTGTQRGVQ